MENLLKDNVVSPFLKKSNNAATFSPLLRQILIATGPLVLCISQGMTLGYSAIMLPQLESKNSSIKINLEESSWIASISTLPMILGCLLSSIFIERFGRKMAIMITIIPWIVGWTTIGMAKSLEVILVGRFVTGLCVGITGPSSSIYIGETSDPKYRGFLLTVASVSTAVGLFVTHLLGTFLAWQIVALTSISLPIACTCLLIFMPESPTWLVNKNRIKQAKQAFYWCRGYSTENVQELRAMIEQQTFSERNHTSWTSMTRPEFWKPLLIMNAFFLTSQLSGVNAVAFYSIAILKDTVGEGMNEYMAMIIIDTIRLIASCVACFLTKRYGRRPLVNCSTIGTTTCLFVLSLFLYMSKSYASAASLTVVPLSALIGYVIFTSIGLVPLPWTMIGEVFPKNTRGVGSGLCSSINFVAVFIVVKTNPAMVQLMGASGVFLCYGCAGLVGALVMYITLPETKGKTLQEIELHYKRTNIRRITSTLV